MTFINARILRKRPNLFVTPKRNYGNLLIKYESGTDGTAPDPDPPAPDPDPVTFTTSWSTNASVVTANLTGISSHRTTEVIVLTRDDGTLLATLDENKVGNWDLQHDEGTSYGSYTYNVRLDGVIKSTFTRDYQPNVPTFTTNFFSNTAKTISCAVENIVNPHDSYSVRLARPDDTILDTQVLNDASSFFLQFTESDYGTYDYKLLLSKWTTASTSNPNIPPESYWVDTVIATHTQLFPRPEPTFTTSWTKSGLTINADLSSIVGAHPDFYAYLCRDDGTTLATHHFTEGETTTSLSFTEADYGTYTYKLKLGTTEVSTHTEIYVRPTPTYTASFSTNELTLTASITSITNAHNSFAITLERDDGTILQTHTLAENETSFNFTQTESSYATFNYVVKINGTQTDTYSATYTPPPIPTFDIAITNTDLAITASITNIANPHSYYTVSIHDASSQLASHIFQSTDTSVSLNWNETTYGEKSYTIKINGVTSSTQSITLTDPNASTPTYRTGTSQAFPLDSGSWFDEGYTLFVDDTPTTASSGVVVNGVRQYEWDLKNSSNNLFPGPDHYFYFIPGSSATSGLWYLGLALASRDGSVITDIHGGGSFNETNAFVDGLVPYGAPAYRTGSSQGFAFTSGNWKNNGYSAVLDDEANSSEGKLVNGVRQWEFDMPDIGGGRLSSGASHWIHFVPGTAEDNGTWYRGGSVGTRSGRTINFGNDATFDETSAFVSGLVPYGDIP